MWFQALKYLQHQFRAKTRYGVHSPFVYEFVTQVMPGRSHPIASELEAMRKELAASKAVLEIEDHGAGYGGKNLSKIQKKLPEILKSSARGVREGGLLHRICGHYQPQACLELGTNLGFSTIYQASALPRSRFVSIEGAPALAGMAEQHFQRLGLKVELLCGEFGAVLESQIDWSSFEPDHVLIDGNHRYAPTMAYFHALLPRVADGAMLIFDDIYWSREMMRAWQEICAHPEVSVSMDLFALGICVVRREQAKEHFRLRF